MFSNRKTQARKQGIKCKANKLHGWRVVFTLSLGWLWFFIHFFISNGSLEYLPKSRRNKKWRKWTRQSLKKSLLCNLSLSPKCIYVQHSDTLKLKAVLLIHSRCSSSWNVERCAMEDGTKSVIFGRQKEIKTLCDEQKGIFSNESKWCRRLNHPLPVYFALFNDILMGEQYILLEKKKEFFSLRFSFHLMQHPFFFLFILKHSAFCSHCCCSEAKKTV